MSGIAQGYPAPSAHPASLSAPHRGIAATALGLFLRGLIAAYQLLIAPLIGPRCRFEPSCSHYAAAAIAAHGPGRGSFLALKRLLRCHP